MKTTLIFTFLFALVFIKSDAQSATTENKKEGKIISTGFWVLDKVQEIQGLKMGPFVRLADGNILTIDSTHSYISKDEGKKWVEYPIFPGL